MPTPRNTTSDRAAARRVSAGPAASAVAVTLLVLATAGVSVHAWRHATGYDARPAVDLNQRIDLNAADAAEMQLLPGIGPTLAQRIVEHRNDTGGFATLEDLRAVPGVGPVTLQRIEPWTVVQASTVKLAQRPAEKN